MVFKNSQGFALLLLLSTLLAFGASAVRADDIASGPAGAAAQVDEASQLQPPQREQMIQGTSAATTDLASQLQDSRINQVAKQTLDQLVAEGVSVIRETDPALADQLAKEWATNNYLADSQLGALDLGDHPPLSKWLASFYETLLKKSGGIARAFRILSDINTINYALPVVLHPHGTWRMNTDTDWIEYRKHFIPFMNIATYWVSYKSCGALVSLWIPKLANFICGKVANKLEWYMGRHVAPQLSDLIYKRANRVAAIENESTLPVSPADLQRELEDLLRSSDLTLN